MPGFSDVVHELPPSQTNLGCYKVEVWSVHCPHKRQAYYRPVERVVLWALPVHRMMGWTGRRGLWSASTPSSHSATFSTPISLTVYEPSASWRIHYEFSKKIICLKMCPLIIWLFVFFLCIIKHSEMPQNFGFKNHPINISLIKLRWMALRWLAPATKSRRYFSKPRQHALILFLRIARQVTTLSLTEPFIKIFYWSHYY